MIETNDSPRFKQLAFALGILSLFALVVTAWVLLNVRHEQAIVNQLVSHLQGNDLQVANELSSELGLQNSLSLLLGLNLIAAAIAFSFLVRGYFSSERNLEDVKVLSADILASMDAGVITTDMTGRVISINPRGRELVGLSTDNKVQNIKQLGPEHALLATVCEEMSKYHHPIRDRDYRAQRDGHSVALRAGCTMLLDRYKEEIGMVIHVRDVTEKALMEERLRRMERYMGLGSLAAGLQHEIKNPLSALSLHIQLLCERLQKETGDQEVNEILEVLNTEVKRISGVLDGFRNYASIHEIGRAPVDVSVMIEKLVRLLRPDAEQKKIKLIVEPLKNVSGLIQADAAQLEQVLLNLALNAFAAMPQGGTLHFKVSDLEGKLSVNISDTGNGIPPEIQSRIFDPYFTTRSDGTGMGLALCDKIVRQHDGSIDFETSPRGTTFTVTLPS
jgi:two-component system nitrogen regulation sensor histidine kinase GlnL